MKSFQTFLTLYNRCRFKQKLKQMLKQRQSLDLQLSHVFAKHCKYAWADRHCLVLHKSWILDNHVALHSFFPNIWKIHPIKLDAFPQYCDMQNFTFIPFFFILAMDTRLAYETLSQILSYLTEDQSALLQINRTCKKLYEVSLPLHFKSPKFESFGCFESFATTLTENNGLLVRHIDLHMVPHRWDSFKINNLLFALSEKTPDLELLNLDLCSQL